MFDGGKPPVESATKRNEDSMCRCSVARHVGGGPQISIALDLAIQDALSA